jgi:phosphoserine phosphatase
MAFPRVWTVLPMSDAFGHLADRVASTLGVPAAFATTVEADRLREVLDR